MSILKPEKTNKTKTIITKNGEKPRTVIKAGPKKKEQTRMYSLYLDVELLSKFDEILLKQGIKNRTKAVEALMRLYIESVLTEGIQELKEAGELNVFDLKAKRVKELSKD